VMSVIYNLDIRHGTYVPSTDTFRMETNELLIHPECILYF
jgi:hypothetical protein